MHDKTKNYLPALRFEFLTRFYDPLVRYTTREYAFKRALLAQADLHDGQTVLDLAGGTGTLSIGIKRRFPGIKVYDFDVDGEILRMARRKAEAQQLEILFEQGYSDNLPFEDKTFDRIFSTLAFHHLTRERKVKTLHEIRRVLKPDGEFHLADYGLARNRKQFILSKFVRAIDGNETTKDNLHGRLLLLMEENGFNVERTGYFKTLLGTIRLFRATIN